jgi:carnitine monooxygenase subunit
MNAAIRPNAAHDAALSLPAWIYNDPEFFELEKQQVFRRSWQLLCHINDIPARGDYHTFDFLGESLVAIRGDDGQVRSFHNVCRHRAARLLDGAKGQCGRRITCPYHAWTYATNASWAYPTVQPSRPSTSNAMDLLPWSRKSSWVSFS